MHKIVIIDYGMGNLRSVQKAIQRLGMNAIISSDKDTLRVADKLILPGVGYFKNGMKKLNDLGLIDVLNFKVLEDKTPILGICLGMQLFTKFSEEGNCAGLGWIDAETIHFNFSQASANLRIPHMGWNNLFKLKESRLLNGVEDSDSFYFVHSYYVLCNNESAILTRTNYGIDFTSSIEKGNITGMQFHPEKSHKAGLKLLGNFLNN